MYDASELGPGQEVAVKEASGRSTGVDRHAVCGGWERPELPSEETGTGGVQLDDHI